MTHYLVEIIARQYARVVRVQSPEETQKRRRKNKTHFSGRALEALQANWMVVASRRDWSKNERLRRHELADSTLLYAEGPHAKQFHQNSEALHV